MTNEVRVRFAPSPTGPLHIGGVRTALFNYFFAKKNSGKLILRIEDTDQKRLVKGAEDYIRRSLDWCGIEVDEGVKEGGSYGPYKQSERSAIYKKHVEILLAKGLAYYAFDKNEKLDWHRKDHEKKGKTFIYNWHNRLKLENSLSLPKEEVKKRIKNKESFVIRFKSPANKKIKIEDLVRGFVEFDSSTLDDKILYKSDGMPTYHLANVVDDHLMNISHVIRGEEWLPSAALHVLLYESFSWKAPQFAHLPLILNPTGNGKLSKRSGAKIGVPVFPVSWKTEKDEIIGFREEGYIPEGLVNFLALLGWNPGSEKELYTIEELCKEFDIKKINNSGAKFDIDRLKWFNHKHLQNMPSQKIAKLFVERQKQAAIMPIEKVANIMGLIKERANTLNELLVLGKYFFEDPKKYNDKAFKKNKSDETIEILNVIVSIIKDSKKHNKEVLEEKIKTWIVDNGKSFGKVMQPIRLALVGELKGVDVFVICEIIGKTKTIRRLDLLIKAIKEVD